MKVQPDPTGPGRSSRVKKWLPLAVILVALATIGAVLAVDADNGQTATAANGGGSGNSSNDGTAGAGSAYPAGVIPFSVAKEQGTVDSIDWGKRCDTTRGLLAMEMQPQPECLAPFKGDNGGATETGVTAESIKVILYVPQENDPVLQFVYRQIGLDDTAEDTWQTYLGLNQLLATYSELYGRKVELVRYNATGTISDSVAGTSDAETIARDLQPFAVIGGPLLTEAFADTLAANGVMCMSCSPAQPTQFYTDRGPYIWDILKNSEQTAIAMAEYVGKRLKGGKAEYGGDAVKSLPRKFGYISLAATPQSEQIREKFTSILRDEYGVTFAEVATFTDPVGVATQAREMLARMKSAGVTTILYNGDPLAPKPLTAAATGQDYFPEWVITGSALVDTTIFSRTFDQQQWAHAFGMSNLPARVDPSVAGAAHTYQWFWGKEPPATQIGVILPNLQLLYNGIQLAGPKLTHESWQKAIFTAPILPGSELSPQVSWGNRGIWPEVDYAGIDDAMEVWWDTHATGPDEVGTQGTGMWAANDGAKRYLPGEWPTAEANLFAKSKDPITLVTKLPPGTEVPNYEPLKPKS